MKKLLFTLVTLLLPLISSADSVLIDGIYYNLIAKAREAEVIQNPNKYTGCIEIPNSVIYNDVVYHVKSISNNAFFECPNVTKVIMPNSVTSIGKAAFYYCGADSIIISENVTSISDMAFACCQNMTSIEIPESVTFIDNSAFNGCVSLTGISIPDHVATIEDWAFAGCKNLSTVNIGCGLNYVGQGAFGDCPSLTSVNISDIAAWCMITFNNYNATPLYQSHHLYLNGEEIVNLVIPDNVTSIGDRTFSCLTNLNTVSISNSVNFIGSCAFSGCSNLNSVTIGRNVTSIGEWAFSGCNKLVTIKIPSGVSYVGRSAFESCGLTELIIPNNVTIIGHSAFKNCSKLSQVTLGSKINSIGSLAFASCQELTDVYCYAKNVPNANIDAFQNSYVEYTTLHVPKASLPLYKGCEPWNSFKSIEALTQEVIDNVDKCATPTIAYDKGELVFSCETEGVKFFSEVKAADAKSNEGERVQLMPTYEISFYATKEGFDDSDVATATITWRDGRPLFTGFSSVTTDGKAANDTNGDVKVDVADIATILSEMAAQSRSQGNTDM
ncbi:MAG: leucine-rich repeat domain-containing protein [Prevotella sp.]|nr:leucine-rich repeat domain-containing protein [Prevotella sp.]